MRIINLFNYYSILLHQFQQDRLLIIFVFLFFTCAVWSTEGNMSKLLLHGFFFLALLHSYKKTAVQILCLIPFLLGF